MVRGIKLLIQWWMDTELVAEWFVLDAENNCRQMRSLQAVENMG